MARSAKQARRQKPSPRKPSPLQEGAAAIGGVLSRNPVAVGGTTAFLISLFYVSANALWYQPYAHKGAFFATRDFSRPLDESVETSGEPETTIRIERPEPEAAAVPARPQGDPVIEQVQGILKTLNFYDGAVDGLSGPATTRAIEAYQRKVGLTVTGQIDDQLLSQLGTAPKTGAIPPAPQPRPTPPASATQQVPVPQPAGMTVSERISRIQQGLRAFGNEGINVDGVAGSQTKSAIREFQSLFGLPATGEPEEAVYRKMKEIGLTN